MIEKLTRNAKINVSKAIVLFTLRVVIRKLYAD